MTRPEDERWLHLVQELAHYDAEPDPVQAEMSLALLAYAEQVRTQDWEQCDLGYWLRFSHERVEAGAFEYNDHFLLMSAVSLIATLASGIENWSVVHGTLQKFYEGDYLVQVGKARALGDEVLPPITETPEYLEAISSPRPMTDDEATAAIFAGVDSEHGAPDSAPVCHLQGCDRLGVISNVHTWTGGTRVSHWCLDHDPEGLEEDE